MSGKGAGGRSRLGAQGVGSPWAEHSRLRYNERSKKEGAVGGESGPDRWTGTASRSDYPVCTGHYDPRALSRVCLQEVEGFASSWAGSPRRSQDMTSGVQCPFPRARPNCPHSLCSTVALPPASLTMDGTASVNSSGRPHYASSIPVPRAASQTRIHTPAASPRLRPHQAGLALSPQRAASPRLGKAGGPSRGSSPKASRGRGSPKPSGAARESAEGAEGLACSPWSSPRATPKAALSSRAGSRSVGETQGTQGKKRVAQEGILTHQTRGRSPSRTSSPGETQVPGAPEGRKPSNHPGKDQRDVPYKSSGGPRSSEPDARAASGSRSPVCSPVRSARPPPAPGAVSFSSVHQQSQPVTATVAPFRYR